MLFHFLSLVCGERAWLEQNGIADLDLAQVMSARSQANFVDVFRREPQGRSQPLGLNFQLLRMFTCLDVSQVNALGHMRHCLFGLIAKLSHRGERLDAEIYRHDAEE